MLEISNDELNLFDVDKNGYVNSMSLLSYIHKKVKESNAASSLDTLEIFNMCFPIIVPNRKLDLTLFKDFDKTRFIGKHTFVPWADPDNANKTTVSLCLTKAEDHALLILMDVINR